MPADALQDGVDLPATLHLYPDADSGPWLLVLFWRVLHGRAECIGMELTSAQVADAPERMPHRPEDAQPLTAVLLRGIRFGELIAKDREAMAGMLVPEEARTYTAPPMRPTTVAKLREVARVYLAAGQAGESPTKAVAKVLGISDTYASVLVTRARAAHLLPPTTPGVATTVQLGQAVERNEAMPVKVVNQRYDFEEAATALVAQFKGPVAPEHLVHLLRDRGIDVHLNGNEATVYQAKDSFSFPLADPLTAEKAAELWEKAVRDLGSDPELSSMRES